MQPDDIILEPKLNRNKRKKTITIITLLLSLNTLNIYAQGVEKTTNKTQLTSIGIVIYSNDVETTWNALRFANYSQNEGDTVTIFLLGKGVELDNYAKINSDLKNNQINSSKMVE